MENKNTCWYILVPTVYQNISHIDSSLPPLITRGRCAWHANHPSQVDKTTHSQGCEHIVIACESQHIHVRNKTKYNTTLVSCKNHATVDGSEIRRSPVEVGRLFHYLRRLLHITRWLFGISEPWTTYDSTHLFLWKAIKLVSNSKAYNTCAPKSAERDKRQLFVFACWFFQLKQDGVCIFLTVSESISGFSFASASYYARESVKNTILSDVFAKPYECPWPIFSALLLGSWKFGSDIPNHHPFDRIFQNSTPPGLMFLLFLGHIPLLSNTLQNFEENNRPSNQKVFGQESLRNHTFWFAYCNFPHLWWFISSWSESNSDIFCRWG